MRLEWGYMLNAFSDSTLIEGYYHDGTLHYPFYGVSLILYVVGIFTKNSNSHSIASKLNYY